MKPTENQRERACQARLAQAAWVKPPMAYAGQVVWCMPFLYAQKEKQGDIFVLYPRSCSLSSSTPTRCTEQRDQRKPQRSS